MSKLQRRGFFAIFTLLVIVVAVGGTAAILCRGLPHPSQADRRELLKWLITKDLKKEPPETVLTLADRLESEFGEGVDWAAFKDNVTEPQRRQLFSNIPSVVRPWMLKKAEAYARLANEERKAFLDRLLDTLEVWRGVENLIPKDAGGTSSEQPPQLATILSQEMDQLKKDAPAAKQEQIDQFWNDVQLHFVMRRLMPKTQS